MKLFVLASAVASLAFLDAVSAHTSLKTPVSREGGREIVEDVNGSVGCKKKMAPGGPVTEVKAGSEIPVEYYRNNHIGGFVRWSLVKKSDEENMDAFEKGVFYYTCRESGNDCNPRNGKPYSLWREAWDGVDTFIIVCGDKIKIPDYLDDGEYVLQFTNFGTGHSMQDPGLATPTYRSCADLKITGGSSKNPRPACPTFVGGDRATKNENKGNDVCSYFQTNEIPKANALFHEKDQSKLDKLYMFGKPAEYVKCMASNGGNAATSSAPAPVTGGAVPALAPAPAPVPASSTATATAPASAPILAPAQAPVPVNAAPTVPSTTMIIDSPGAQTMLTAATAATAAPGTVHAANVTNLAVSTAVTATGPSAAFGSPATAPLAVAAPVPMSPTLPLAKTAPVAATAPVVPAMPAAPAAPLAPTVLATTATVAAPAVGGVTVPPTAGIDPLGAPVAPPAMQGVTV
ncbi:hypothetical protein Poli38472_009955 [Pythium oligandrum]|uniref:Auxiliary Activity family 9 catalytic domain-containing protein n=1 Tax=Pythium oligandrum TaxID=41045 RepID=A0A8K1FDI4_PYTOL|nr:hypothetical protein Poli38472_009955 [Pythium oligandrum]|eukprot:TMW58396.1 hypothetical protein Poli38472_009955 [Pythium oligandrum]